MTSLALLPDIAAPTPEPIELLIADDDSNLRAVVASRAALAREGLVVHEAEDGGEAIQVALQRRPQFALLELNMPGLDGVEVALVLRELLPGMRLALYSADPSAHCDTAREFCLPLFDKVESDAALRWLMKQDVRTRSLHASARTPYRGIALECSACTYGIAASLPPERCCPDVPSRRSLDASRTRGVPPAVANSSRGGDCVTAARDFDADAVAVAG